MEEKIKISMLCQIYGKLLTKKQYELLDDYYNNDLSLSEIAENNDITRQAVRDNLKKGEAKLFEYEESLGLMKKSLLQEEIIKEIMQEMEKTQIESKAKENIMNKLKKLV